MKMNSTLDDLHREWEMEFSYGPTHIIKEKIVADLLESLQDLRVLDLGCGGGRYTRFLEKSNQVIALDLSPLSVLKTKEIRKQKGMNLVAQVLHLPFQDKSIDAIVAFDVLEHIERDKEAVEEIWRVLKPKGKLLFVVPEDPRLFSQIDVANGHFRRYTLESIKTLLKGFTIVNLSDFGFPLMRIYLRLFANRLLAVRSQASPNALVRLGSPALTLMFQFDRIFNGSFRGVELFGIAQKSG